MTYDGHKIVAFQTGIAGWFSSKFELTKTDSERVSSLHLCLHIVLTFSNAYRVYLVSLRLKGADGRRQPLGTLARATCTWTRHLRVRLWGCYIHTDCQAKSPIARAGCRVLASPCDRSHSARGETSGLSLPCGKPISVSRCQWSGARWFRDWQRRQQRCRRRRQLWDVDLHVLSLLGPCYFHCLWRKW